LTPSMHSMHSGAPFFRETGKGPGVVCPHSNASSSTQWRGLMAGLKARFHVLAPDAHGAVAAFAGGNPAAAAEHFIDYWMGAGAWGRTPEPRRAPIAAAIVNVRGWANALFGAPTPWRPSRPWTSRRC
jgi:hypothetical protein